MKDPSDAVDVVDGVAYRYSSSWIHSLESEEHWRLYWRQQEMMEGLVSPGEHVLEIGVGSGFTANYLRSRGIPVTTIDIDAEKEPDIVANIVGYDFPDSFAHILGFEVFEHIPFEEFRLLLNRLAGACEGCLFLSVPCNERVWLRCSLRLPKIGHHLFEITTTRNAIREEHHFWEVGYAGVTQDKLEHTFRSAGFSLERRQKAFSRLFYALRSPNTG